MMSLSIRNNNFAVLSFRDCEVCFSYGLPMALRVGSRIYFAPKVSVTSSRHVNEWAKEQPSEATRECVDNDTFESLIALLR